MGDEQIDTAEVPDLHSAVLPQAKLRMLFGPRDLSDIRLPLAIVRWNPCDPPARRQKRNHRSQLPGAARRRGAATL